MAAKENDRSKTSKTARVMNLLSKKQDAAPAVETEEAPAPASASLPPIISSLAPDAAVSVQIKSALEDALEEELNASSAPAEPTPSAAAAPAAPQPVAASPAASPVSTVSTDENAPAPVEPSVSAASVESPASAAPAEESAPAPVEPPMPAAAPVPVQSAPPATFDSSLEAANRSTYINVMQVLVEEKAEKYVKMFGLCTCHQCMDDVKALALNHLPPKYVVMDAGDRIPKLTFYEGQYSSDITAQLLKACEVVHRRPHHTR